MAPDVRWEPLNRAGAGGTKRLEVWRARIPAAATLEDSRPGEESLLYVPDGEATLCYSLREGDWLSALHPGAAIWLPAGSEYRLANRGAGELSCVRFSVRLEAAEIEAEEQRPSSMALIEVRAQPVEDWVTFLSRVVLSGEAYRCKAFMLSEFETLHPGGSVPSHVHEGEEEICYVIRGRRTAILDGRRSEVKAGETVYVPPRVRHAMNNEADDLLEYILGQARIGDS